MGVNKNSRRKTVLSSGRPPNSQKSKSTLSSKSTRTTIRQYHTLSKRLARARSTHDEAQITALESQISALGGLAAYQAASAQGQAHDRGGDTSIELMRWLSPMITSLLPPHPLSKSSHDLNPSSTTEPTSPPSPPPTLGSGKQVQSLNLHLLEIGALSTHNACARPDVFGRIERIDLRARIPGITRQDFMERPLPADDGAKFDVLSLSLVLNFVPEARGRGDMLRRTAEFLRRSVGRGEEGKEDGREKRKGGRGRGGERGGEGEGGGGGGERDGLSGLLFLVLPAPCVVNSRYFDDERLGRIMASIGYELRRRKQTAKLVYYLWQLAGKPTGEEVKKALVRDGKGMNNFCVELRT